MDSRGPQGGQPHQNHHHHHHQHHRHQPPQQLPPPQQPPRMMMHHHHHTPPPNSSPYHQHGPTNPNPTIITQNSSPLLQSNNHNTNNNNNRFPFNNNNNQQTTPSNQSVEQLNSGVYTGDGLRGPHGPGPGSGSGPGGFGFDPHKKKRGRPRKYSPDGGASNIALALAPTPISPPIGGGGNNGGGGGNNGGGCGNNGGGGGQGDSSGTTHSSEHKKHRGRPPSSSKKQLDALGNCGVGFTPHVILVNAGENIASKIMAFSKEGPRTVCILSANGSICNVSLHQSAMSGVVNYEGRFDIISLSGSFLFSESNGGQVRTGGLSVSLAGTDGRVLGGGVAGMLVAASPVQIIVGSFIADGKKPKYMPSVPNSHMLSFSAPTESPVSQEASSEGSEENGSNNINRNMGSHGNSNHPIHNMQMYSSMDWPNSG